LNIYNTLEMFILYCKAYCTVLCTVYCLLCCNVSGKRSLETICLLLAYKIKFPENFFLLRGNHEAAQINRSYLLT